MGCNPILEHHCRVVAALLLTLSVNGPLDERKNDKHKQEILSALCCASVTRGFCCGWNGWMLIG